MRTLTKEEEDKLKHAIKTNLKGLHAFRIIVWDAIDHPKRDKFLECINNGMHWEAAYQTAKKLRKIK